MVDTVSPLTPFSRANPIQSANPNVVQRSTNTVEETKAANDVQSAPNEGVEVILTQSERRAEELTYENLRPNRSAQRADEPNQGELNPADEILRQDTLNPNRV